MKKSTILFFIILFFGVIVFAFVKNFSSKNISDTKVQQQQSKQSALPNENKVDNKLFISGWLPYWQKEEGAKALEGKINSFNEINIFAYSVNVDGTLKDTAQVKKEPWLNLESEARRQNVAIIPTILWGDAAAMHKVFSNQDLLIKHVDAIMQMIEQNNFNGIDIDYEGKDIADKDNFSKFIKALHQKLQTLNKKLECTVEARTQDFPPRDFTGVRAMSWANDYGALNDNCDSIRIMAYDQVFQVYRAKSFETSSQKPYAPNADISWVRDVINYTLKYIDARRISLGVPTYGWQFKISKNQNGYKYIQEKSISYPDAIRQSQSANIIPKRNEGGEMDYVFNDNTGQHLVNFSDAESIKQKISLAKELKLNGISLFKLDGLYDPAMIEMLKSE